MTRIYVDADGCPVKDEVYRVARRYRVPVTLVANTWMRTPDDDDISLHVVGEGFDEADDWIVEQAGPSDIAITADIPLAARCLKKGARALNPNGRVYTEASIGGALATREILSHLREHGATTGGPAPFSKENRSRFLGKLDEAVQASVRESQDRE
jgi:hypothetical protein